MGWGQLLFACETHIPGAGPVSGQQNVQATESRKVKLNKFYNIIYAIKTCTPLAPRTAALVLCVWKCIGECPGTCSIHHFAHLSRICPSSWDRRFSALLKALSCRLQLNVNFTELKHEIQLLRGLSPVGWGLGLPALLQKLFIKAMCIKSYILWLHFNLFYWQLTFQPHERSSFLCSWLTWWKEFPSRRCLNYGSFRESALKFHRQIYINKNLSVRYKK